MPDIIDLCDSSDDEPTPNPSKDDAVVCFDSSDDEVPAANRENLLDL